MKAAEEAIRSDAPAVRVVVVEDDHASADVLQRRLQANGMVVSVAHDGRQGIALVEELLPDLVLLDVMLPDTDGYDVCLRIKSNGATAPIPVIFLSARGEVVDKVRGLSCGAADYITKPFQAAELLARIDAVLGQARSPRIHRSLPTSGGRPSASERALASPSGTGCGVQRGVAGSGSGLRGATPATVVGTPRPRSVRGGGPVSGRRRAASDVPRAAGRCPAPSDRRPRGA